MKTIKTIDKTTGSANELNGQKCRALAAISFQFTTLAALAVGLVLCLGVQSTLALDIRIDYSTSSANPGGNWNSLASGNTAVASLADFNTGLGTGVGVTGVGWGQAFSWGVPVSWNGGVPLGWIDPAAAIDMVNKGPGVNGLASINLSGLNDTESYIVEVLDNHSFNSGGPQNITVQGAFANGGPGGNGNFLGIAGQNGQNWDGMLGSPSVPSENWLIWNNVASGAGMITINFQTSGAFAEPSLNALRISAVPEPTTSTLLGLGSLALMMVRRRM